MTIVSVGEILWDVIGGEEHLGGAPFNFAVHTCRLGHEVLFVSGVGDDDRGRRALEQAQALGLSTNYIRKLGGLPTGVATVELAPDGQPSFRVHRPAAYDGVVLRKDEAAVIVGRRPGWIYFGTLQQMSKTVRELTEQLIRGNPESRCFYDINLRPDGYTPELVEQLASQADVAKLNQEESDELGRWFDLPTSSIEEFCRAAASQFGWQAVAVTRGADGCALLIGDEYCDAPGVRVEVVDAVGAGDAFSAAFLHGLDAGWPVGQVAGFANCVGALVAGRPGATPAWTIGEIQPAAGE